MEFEEKLWYRPILLASHGAEKKSVIRGIFSPRCMYKRDITGKDVV